MPKLFTDAGTAFLAQTDGLGSQWEAVVQVGQSPQVSLGEDLDSGYGDEFDTPGQALDALAKWAADRGLIVATGLFELRKPSAEMRKRLRKQSVL